MLVIYILDNLCILQKSSQNTFAYAVLQHPPPVIYDHPV